MTPWDAERLWRAASCEVFCSGVWGRRKGRREGAKVQKRGVRREKDSQNMPALRGTNGGSRRRGHRQRTTHCREKCTIPSHRNSYLGFRHPGRCSHRHASQGHQPHPKECRPLHAGCALRSMGIVGVEVRGYLIAGEVGRA